MMTPKGIKAMLDGGVKVRFAPSPTGRLHVGNLRTALMNWLFARHHGGQFLLRMDDTDTERSKMEYERGIVEDLKWLGVDWDDFARQSARNDRYDRATEILRNSGRLYPCYETPEELELKRKIQLGQGKPPVYDRAALDMTPEEQAALAQQGRKPHWRFKLLEEAVEWDDLGRGPVRFEAGHLSDPVLIREDGRPLYTLTSVVDDGEMFITHVMRGEDHVVNTAVQVQLFRALDFPVPSFAHMPLMVGADGKGLSKRVGSLGIGDLREAGIEGLALVAYLAHLGTPIAPDGSSDMADLIRHFDLSSFGRASPRYDTAELEALSTKVIHRLPFSQVQQRLQSSGIEDVDQTLWLAVRENIETLDDIRNWVKIANGDVERPVDLVDDDLAYLKTAADLLPEAPLDDTSWKTWTTALKEETGRKGKQLFMPLRLSLTGLSHGPDMGPLLPLIDRDRIVERLVG